MLLATLMGGSESQNDLATRRSDRLHMSESDLLEIVGVERTVYGLKGTKERKRVTLLYICMQVSYAIGVAEPLSIFISSYGTGIKSDADLLKIVKANFDLRPGKIVK